MNTHGMRRWRLMTHDESAPEPIGVWARVDALTLELESLQVILDMHEAAAERHNRQYDDLQDRITRALTIHAEDGFTPDGSMCGECLQAWPCPTVQILRGES